MTLHADALGVLRAWAPPTADQEILRDRYVAHLESRPDGLSRTCLPDHVTASTLVFNTDHTQVLLTLHAKSGRWFQFGGHPEAPDQTLVGAALREALEESGLAADELTIDPRPVLLDEHAVPFCGPDGARHLDVMFRAVAGDGSRHQVSEESLDVAWWPVDGLPSDELSGFVAIAQSSSEGGGSIRTAADQPSR